jgi:hypothetical protein
MKKTSDGRKHSEVLWTENKPLRTFFSFVLLAVFLDGTGQHAQTRFSFVHLEKASTRGGYLARLLINETPFPGERGYESEANTKSAMLEILWVLHSRLHLIPEGYTQQEVTGVRSSDIIDVITGTGGRRQCEGFYRNASGQFVVDPRVEERVDYLLKIANSGEKPGRFAALLNYAQGLARAYLGGGIEGADLYAYIVLAPRVLSDGEIYKAIRQEIPKRGGVPPSPGETLTIALTPGGGSGSTVG